MAKPFSNLLIQRFAGWQTVVFFVALVSALAVACKKDNPLGLDLQPTGQFDSLQFVDTFTVHAHTLLAPRQRSDEAQPYIGRVVSDVFGVTESALITNFQLITGNVGKYGGYKLDSVVLCLRPNAIFGVAQDPVNVEVYELGQSIRIDSAYYSDFVPALKGLVGSGTFVRPNGISLTDSITVNGTREAFHFRLPLDPALGTHLLEMLADTGVKTTALFQQTFGGLMVKPTAGTSATGAIYLFALLTGESGIRLYVSKDTNNGTLRQTITFPINGECARINQFTHDYGSSLAANYIGNGQTRNDLIFVQGLSGTCAEIRVPGLKTFGEMGQYAVSKATLSFQLADEQLSALGHSTQLYLLDLDNSGTETLTPDYLYSKSRSGGKYNTSNNSFEFDVTRHVQRILVEVNNGETPTNEALRLHAQVPVLNGNDTAMNVLKGLDNIVLKLYHTDLNN